MSRAGLVRSEQGAVLVHVTIALMGLMALSAFVVDYGVLWVARRQAQNAADAGAIAGAIVRGFGNMDDHTGAKQAAMSAVRQNPVWGEAPDINSGDVDPYEDCPPGSPGAGIEGRCVRVDVYRNQERSNPIPTLIAGLVGVDSQGVRATATAEVMFSDSSDCVRPFAIADKWVERFPTVGSWSQSERFERYRTTAPNQGEVIPGGGDVYLRPGSGRFGPNGTGFTHQPAGRDASDNGRRIVLDRHGDGPAASQVAAGWYQPVQLTPGAGGSRYADDIGSCNPTMIGPNTVLESLANDPRASLQSTVRGIRDLMDRDRSASWNASLNGGQGGIEGGCMSAGTCTVSPRLIAIPVYDPDRYQREITRPPGPRVIEVVKIVGLFLQEVRSSGEIVGRIMTYPSVPRGGTSTTPGAAFVVSIALVR